MMPLLMNKWAIELLFPLYIGRNLSMRNIVFAGIIGVVCLVEAVRLLRGGKLCIREKAFFLTIFAVICFPYLLFLSKSGDLSNITDLVYGEMLSFIPLSLLILALPRIGLVTALLIQSIVCFIESYYIHQYGAMPGVSFLYVFMESNPGEAGEFISEYVFSISVILFWVVMSGVFYLFFRCTRRFDSTAVRRLALALLVCLIPPMLVKGSFYAIPRGNFFIKCAISFLDYRKVHEDSRRAMQVAMQQTPPIQFAFERPAQEVHMLIIGESADRDYMSIYGYPLPTTPRLEAMRSELFLFNNVVSPFITTIPNIRVLTSFENYEHRDRTIKDGCLTSYLKAAGYQTTWISNQVPLGIHDTLTTVVAKSCDETIFVNRNQSENQPSYDELLLPALQDVLTRDTPRKFIIIHLMGLHTPFRFRYPDEYDIFHEAWPGKTDRQRGLVNRYHNAMLYNDAIVANLIEAVKKTNTCASVIYLSDHGLELFETRDYHGHSITGGLEIPLIAWVSDEYRSLHPNKVAQWSAFLDRPYMTDDMIYSVFDLLGMETKTFEPQRSIFSPDFVPRKRIVHLFDYSHSMDYDADDKQ